MRKHKMPVKRTRRRRPVRPQRLRRADVDLWQPRRDRKIPQRVLILVEFG